LYLGSTILLTSTYRPEEKAKVQAANEFVLFCVVTVVSLATGVIFAGLGWKALNLCMLPLIAMSAVALFAFESGKHRHTKSKLLKAALFEEVSEILKPYYAKLLQ
jgi:hypothetical protein